MNSLMSRSKLAKACPKHCDVFPTYVDYHATSYLYFITFTLKPKYYNVSASEQLVKTYDKLCQILKIYPGFFTLVPELTLRGNIHYHGVWWINDPSQYQTLLKRVRTVIGNYDSKLIKPNIKDLERVWKYMHKDIPQTQDMIPSWRIHCYSNGEPLEYFRDHEDRRKTLGFNPLEKYIKVINK